MEGLKVAIIGTLMETLLMLLVFVYIYYIHRSRYVRLWLISWLLLVSRLVLFDFNRLLLDKDSWQFAAGMGILSILVSICHCLGTYYLFRTRMKYRLNRIIIFSAILTLATALAGQSFFGTAIYGYSSAELMSSMLTLMVACIRLINAILFLSSENDSGKLGCRLTGYCFLVLFVFRILQVPIWRMFSLTTAYVLVGALRSLTAVGAVIVFFENIHSELTDKERRLLLYAENTSDVIFMMSGRYPQIRIVLLNDEVEKLTGYRAVRFCRKPLFLYSLVIRDDRKKLDEFIKRFPHSADELTAFRITDSKGSLVWIEAKYKVILEKNGVTKVIGVIRNISERKNMELVINSYEQMNLVSGMAATVAHEIRNPLTTVHGYLQLFSSKKAYNSDHKNIRLMIAELDRANSIITEYLSLAKNKRAKAKHCSLNDVVMTIYPLLQVYGCKYNVNINTDVTQNIMDIVADENEIKQMILNMVRNGIEAMPDGGEIVIRTCKTKNENILMITDQGEGISEQVLKCLGTPFVTTKKNGTGLGLAACYQIAKHNNARIEVQTSKAGTTFSVHFSKVMQFVGEDACSGQLTLGQDQFENGCLGERDISIS